MYLFPEKLVAFAYFLENDPVCMLQRFCMLATVCMVHVVRELKI